MVARSGKAGTCLDDGLTPRSYDHPVALSMNVTNGEVVMDSIISLTSIRIRVNPFLAAFFSVFSWPQCHSIVFKILRISLVYLTAVGQCRAIVTVALIELGSLINT
jgi:hypothetical protein